MARNIEELNIDEITEDFLRNQCIEMGMELGVDTRQGSIYRDAAEGHIIRAKKFFEDLKQVGEIISLTTCTGDVLDQKMRERGLARNPPEATPAHYYCLYNGATPLIGDLVTCQGHAFHVESVGERIVIVSEETGTAMNSLAQGTPVIPDIDVDGLIQCTLEEIADPALDPEDDDTARTRLINKIAGPDENGNASQIRTWCESVEGVGRARIIPLWNGPMTVKAVIIGRDGRGGASAVVANVQEYVDPGITGMGEGVASIGQFVTVVAAQNLTINVSVSVMKKAEATYSEIKEDLEEELTEYFKTLALETWSEDLKVRYNRISAIITGMDAVIDHAGLLINGAELNVPFSILQVPVLGEVTVDGNIL